MQNDPVNFVDPSGLNMSSGSGCGGSDVTYYVDGVLSDARTACGILASGGGVIGPASTTQWSESAGTWVHFRATIGGSGWIPQGARYIGRLSWAHTNWNNLRDGLDPETQIYTLSQDRISQLGFWGGQFASESGGVFRNVHGSIIGERGIETDYGTQFGIGGLLRGLIGRAGGAATAQIGTKLDYLFGRATGNAHNIARSTQMFGQMQRIGIFDTVANRAYLQTYFNHVVRNSSNIVLRQANGRVVRESLLMGPNGGLNVQSIWEGRRLITFNLFGGP